MVLAWNVATGTYKVQPGGAKVPPGFCPCMILTACGGAGVIAIGTVNGDLTKHMHVPNLPYPFHLPLYPLAAEVVFVGASGKEGDTPTFMLGPGLVWPLKGRRSIPLTPDILLPTGSGSPLTVPPITTVFGHTIKIQHPRALDPDLAQEEDDVLQLVTINDDDEDEPETVTALRALRDALVATPPPEAGTLPTGDVDANDMDLEDGEDEDEEDVAEDDEEDNNDEEDEDAEDEDDGDGDGDEDDEDDDEEEGDDDDCEEGEDGGPGSGPGGGSGLGGGPTGGDRAHHL